MTIYWLTPKEEGDLLLTVAETGARNEAMVRLMTGTGMREGELIPLICRDFDWERGTVELNKHTIAAYELTKTASNGSPTYKPARRLTTLEYDWDGLTGKKRKALPATLADEYSDLKKALIISGLKASKQVRTLPLMGVTRAFMKDWMEGYKPSNFVFRSPRGGMLHRASVFRIIQRSAQRAGLAPEKCHPHALRHTFAIRYLRKRKGQGLAELSRILGHASIATTAIYLQFVVSDLRDAMEAAGVE